MAELSGKVALVTGASRGAGRVIALRLAKASAAVAILARGRDKLEAVAGEIQAKGGQALVVVADVADAQAVEAGVAAAEARFGGLDILVNNAGIGPNGPSASFPLETWREVLDTNLTGPFVCSRAVYPALKRRGGGQIIAIASGAARQGYPRLAAYSASKFGLVGLMQALAAEWGGDGIKVSTILPGSILTGFGGRSADERSRETGRKYIRPEDVADAVVYLLTQPVHAWTQEMNLWPF
ncbi:MAG TPA: SDR family NAD(P)-dependent oxidoreductase [Chloroflexota bacterium]|nr:SDR family NAD(P)-dependent oxidoreductase [Chloroflexota bacterium]